VARRGAYTGAGPIGIMAAAVVRHAGARYVVITDGNPYRLELARKVGVTLAVDACSTRLADVQTEIGMREGFDVGLEMSGNPAAFRDMLANMCHGAKIAMLGIPSEDMAIDWNTVIFNMLTIKGIYGREMYETWYKVTVRLQSGLDISPVITHRFPFTEFQEARVHAQLRWHDRPQGSLAREAIGSAGAPRPSAALLGVSLAIAVPLGIVWAPRGSGADLWGLTSRATPRPRRRTGTPAQSEKCWGPGSSATRSPEGPWLASGRAG